MERKDRISGNRAWNVGRWNGGWRSDSWASARGLWKRPTPEEQAHDEAAWREAADEAGTLPRVLWCEMCQLLGDIAPRGTRVPSTRSRPAPEQAEG